MQAPRPQPEQESRSGTTPGIIDTLGNAFALLNRRPYLVWLPIVFDLMLWTGFRLSVADPLAWAGNRLGDRLADAELISLAGVLIPTLIGDLTGTNVVSLSLADGFAAVGPAGSVLLLMTLATAVLLGVSYLTMIGRLVSDRPAWGLRFAGDCLLNAVRSVGLILSAVCLVAFLFVPFLALGIALWAIGINSVLMLSIIAAVFLIWAGIFFIFGVHALALGETGAFRAMRSSYNVVRSNFLSVIGLLLVIVLIRAGTPLALQVFTEIRWSVPFAIIVNAYVATGLIAATMIYFRDRASDTFTSPVAMNAAGASR